MYTRVSLKQAMQDAWQRRHGAQSVIYVPYIIFLVIFFIADFYIIKSINPKTISMHLQNIPMSHNSYRPLINFTGILHHPGYLVLFLVVAFLVGVYGCIWQSTIARRCWLPKVSLGSFFAGFKNIKNSWPVAVVIALLPLVFVMLQVITNVKLNIIVLFIFLLSALLLSAFISLYNTYIAATTLNSGAILQEIFTRDGAQKSLLSLAWCKVKFGLLLMLFEVVFVVLMFVAMFVFSFIYKMAGIPITFVISLVALASLVFFILDSFVPFLFLIPSMAAYQIVSVNPSIVIKPELKPELSQGDIINK
jgi:hypothetical protein